MSEQTAADTARSCAGTDDKGPYDPEKLIGSTLAGRYEIERCIGKGGMGVVYLARQRALERMVVIKVLSRALDNDDEASGRFEREAVGMSRLHHPNVVAIYDFGHEDDQAYICMEFVDGETLSRRLKRDGAMSVETFSHIAIQLLKGIGEAHSLGLIHRDIKPGNIMLTERHGQQDYVKILDFGLAKLVHNARKVTKEQSLVGSTSFLSPEQIMGNDIDQRVDVYALGVLFYYMLTGEKPFTADDDITVLYQHVHHPPPPLIDHLPEGHGAPRELVALVERMLAKEPDDRPLNAGRVHDEMAAIMAGISSVDMPPEDGEGSNTGAPVAVDEASSTHSEAADVPREPSLTISHTPPSGQTFVTGEQMLAMQKASTRNTVLIIVTAFLVFAAGFGAFWMLRDSHASAASVQAEIMRAEELVDQGKLGRAESVLELAKPDLSHHPSLKERFAASQDKLAIARLLADARFHEQQGQLQGAISDYRQVLSRNPDQSQAKEALARLVAELERKEASARADKAAVEQEPEGEVGDEATPDEVTPDEVTRQEEPAANAARARTKRKPAKTPATARTPGTRRAGTEKKSAPHKDNRLLLPIGDKEASDEPTNDDVQLLPID